MCIRDSVESDLLKQYGPGRKADGKGVDEQEEQKIERPVQCIAYNKIYGIDKTSESNERPVSYTHLDVYKRQVPCSRLP